MARLGVNDKAARQPHWPDRAAHLRRRRARKVFRVVVVLLLVLPWLGYRSVRDWIGPGAADPPAAPVATVPASADAGHAAPAAATSSAPSRPTRDVEAVSASGAQVEALGRDAGRGDEEQVMARLASLDARTQREAMLADRGSAIRREPRARGRGDAGVRAAGWVDRMSMRAGRPAARAAPVDCRGLPSAGCAW